MKHNPRLPVSHTYQKTPSGIELVFSLYTRGCRYGKCSFCSLYRLSAGQRDVSAEAVMAQVDYIISQYTRRQLNRVEKVSIFNSGSGLDQETLPTSAMFYLFERIAEFRKLRIVSIESRTEYIDEWELRGLLDRLGKRQLELAIGFETRSPHIRNRVLRKGLTEAEFSGLCRMLARNNVRLKAYVMVKPSATMSETQGVAEAVRSLRHLNNIRKRLKLHITAHLNPTYVARGSALEKKFRKHSYQPPRLWSVVDILLKMKGSGLPIQLGLSTEGLAISGGSFKNCGRCDKRVLRALRAFSAGNDYSSLNKLDCSCRIRSI